MKKLSRKKATDGGTGIPSVLQVLFRSFSKLAERAAEGRPLFRGLRIAHDPGADRFVVIHNRDQRGHLSNTRVTAGAGATLTMPHYRLRELMDARDMSTSDLARRSGVSASTITNLLHDRAEAVYTTLDRLATALGVAPEDLVEPTSEHVP